MYGAWFDEFSNKFLVVFYEPDMLHVNIWISEAKTITSLTTKWSQNNRVGYESFYKLVEIFYMC